MENNVTEKVIEEAVTKKDTLIGAILTGVVLGGVTFGVTELFKFTRGKLRTKNESEAEMGPAAEVAQEDEEETEE